MSRSPFKIHRPLAIAFSGGRTSAYMLRRIMDAYGGSLPNRDCHVLFANTGKERDETLEFVNDIETRWSVPVTWLEYSGQNTYRVVNYETAHRRHMPGPPLQIVIDERGNLPNPACRYCTEQCKIRTMKRYLTDQGWDNTFCRRQAIGIRHDESHRTIQILADCPSYIIPTFPLVDAKITEADVLKFWSKQEFDLQLLPEEGNCDLCFLKGRAKLIRIIKAHPEFAEWWRKMEESKRETATTGAYFREDRSFAGLISEAKQRGLFDDLPDDEIACACGTGAGDWCDTEGDDV